VIFVVSLLYSVRVLTVGRIRGFLGPDAKACEVTLPAETPVAA
jgi:hypothetical protein